MEDGLHEVFGMAKDEYLRELAQRAFKMYEVYVETDEILDFTKYIKKKVNEDELFALLIAKIVEDYITDVATDNKLIPLICKYVGEDKFGQFLMKVAEKYERENIERGDGNERSS